MYKDMYYADCEAMVPPCIITLHSFLCNAK